MAFHTEVPPATSSVVFDSTYTWGDDAWMDGPRGRRRRTSGRCRSTRCTSARGGAGRSYAELADELVAYVVETRLHARRVPAGDGAPVRRLVGLPGHVVLRADRALRRPRRPALPGRPAAPGRHRRASWTGCPRTSPRTSGRWPASTAPRSTRTRTRTAASTRTGAPTSSTSAAARCATSSSPTRCTGSRSSTSTACGSTRVASMLYLDYSREAGEWTPNVHGGRENLEAVQFLQEMNATVYKRVPGRDHDRRGVDVLAGRHPADPPAAASASASSGTWAGCTTRLGYVEHDPMHRQYHHGQMTFSLVYAYSENFVLPISHDEVVHGKGSLLRKMPGDRWQQLANLRAYLAYMWAHPGKQLLFMGSRVRPGVGVGRGPRAGLVAARPRRPPRRALAGAGPEPDLQGHPRALVAGQRPGSASQWIDANDAGNNVFSFIRSPKDPATRPLVCVANFSAVPHHDYRLGLPAGRRVDRGAQHRRRRVRRLRRRQPRRGRGRRGRAPRPARVGDAHRAAARDALAPPDELSPAVQETVSRVSASWRRAVLAALRVDVAPVLPRCGGEHRGHGHRPRLVVDVLPPPR